MKVPNKFKQIARQVDKMGGIFAVAGGALRDWKLGKTPDDIDFVIAGLTVTEVKSIISSMPNKEMMQMFSNDDHQAPVFGVHVNGEWFEIAMARVEVPDDFSKSGFRFQSSKNVTLEQDAVRRDFTVNAGFFNILTGETVDFVGMEQDLNDKVLKAVSDSFPEAPDRPWRGFQQAPRFGFRIHENVFHFTEVIFKDAVWIPNNSDSIMGQWKGIQVVSDSVPVQARVVPVEQLWKQFDKFSRKAIKPSIGIEFIQNSELANLMPEMMVIDPHQVDTAVGKENQAVWIFAEMIRNMNGNQRKSFFDKIDAPKQIRKKAVEFVTFNGPRPKNIVSGKDVMDITGMNAGKNGNPEVGRIVKAAFDAQVKGEFTNHASGIEWVKKFVSS